MPIYEFYCAACHTVLSFLSPRIDTEAHPACPHCGAERLPKKPSTFAALSGRTGEGEEAEGGEDDLLAGLDEERLGGAVEEMAREAETAGDEDDPRAMARLFRRFGEAAGLAPGDRLEEMLGRLEAGEDPEELEAEIGDALDDDSAEDELFRPAAGGAAKGGRGGPRAARRGKPRVDPELYFL